MEAIKRDSLVLDREAIRHLDGCLGCGACETACPSGVSFRERMEEFRPRLRPARLSRTWRAAIAAAAQSSTALRAASSIAYWLDRAGLESLRRRVPALGIMRGAWGGARELGLKSFLHVRVPPPSRPRARVALLTGCAAAVLEPDVNAAAVQVLRRHGIDVVDASLGCCGALALHSGRIDDAKRLALHNTRTIAVTDVDYVVTTAAGCGAMLKEYGRVLGGEPSAESARGVSARSRDICELLCELGIDAPARPLDVGSVAYHDACHLLHAAKVADAPRVVVEMATGRRPIDLGENYVCCGSAGSYNLERPAMARQLGRRKAELARESGASVITVGNVGCALQIEQALAVARLRVPVVHPVELLAEAYARCANA